MERLCRDCEFWERSEFVDDETSWAGFCSVEIRAYQPDPDGEPDVFRRDTLLECGGLANACRHWNALSRQDTRDVATVAAQVWGSIQADPLGEVRSEDGAEFAVECARKILAAASRRDEKEVTP